MDGVASLAYVRVTEAAMNKTAETIREIPFPLPAKLNVEEQPALLVSSVVSLVTMPEPRANLEDSYCWDDVT
jgi:hypothetical protein